MNEHSGDKTSAFLVASAAVFCQVQVTRRFLCELRQRGVWVELPSQLLSSMPEFWFGHTNCGWTLEFRWHLVYTQGQCYIFAAGIWGFVYVLAERSISSSIQSLLHLGQVPILSWFMKICPGLSKTSSPFAQMA